jgi:hypothetical protein
MADLDYDYEAAPPLSNKSVLSSQAASAKNVCHEPGYSVPTLMFAR